MEVKVIQKIHIFDTFEIFFDIKLLVHTFKFLSNYFSVPRNSASSKEFNDKFKYDHIHF